MSLRAVGFCCLFGISFTVLFCVGALFLLCLFVCLFAFWIFAFRMFVCSLHTCNFGLFYVVFVVLMLIIVFCIY